VLFANIRTLLAAILAAATSASASSATAVPLSQQGAV